ncbi:hypothetical protein GCM10027290_30730 [Micromonospora sonneratiae]
MPLVGRREVSLHELIPQCGGHFVVVDQLRLDDRFGDCDRRGVGRGACGQVDARARALDCDAFDLGLPGEDDAVPTEMVRQAASQPVCDVVLGAKLLAVR